MKKDSICKIGGNSIVAILVTFIGTTNILTGPFALTESAGQDAWIVPWLALPLSISIVYVCCNLGSLFPEQGFVQYLPSIVGKFMGKVIGLAYVLFLWWFTATVIREAVSLLYGVGIFRVTPPLAVGLLLLVATTYAAASGIEGISRSLWLIWLITVVFYIMVLLLTIPSLKFGHLLPVGEASLKALCKGSLISHAFRGEIFFLLFLFPYIRSKSEALKGGVVSTVILSLFISLTIVVCIAVMGVEETTRNYFSIFAVDDYLEITGIKIVLTTIWIFVFWGKIALGQFAATTALAELCGFKDARFLILPAAIMLLIFSEAFYPDNTNLYESITATLPGLMLFMAYLIPGLLLLVALIRLKWGRLDSISRWDSSSSP